MTNILRMGFPGGSGVKNLLPAPEMWVRSLDWEDPLEEEMATCSGNLACGIPWTEEPGKLQSMRLQSRGRLSTQACHLRMAGWGWWVEPTPGRVQEAGLEGLSLSLGVGGRQSLACQPHPRAFSLYNRTLQDLPWSPKCLFSVQSPPCNLLGPRGGDGGRAIPTPPPHFVAHCGFLEGTTVKA